MKVKFKRSGKEVEIYGVRKSGPSDDGSQTKFLIYTVGKWSWMPCSIFEAIDPTDVRREISHHKVESAEERFQDAIAQRKTT